MEFHPLTPDRWSDLEKLFGPRGAYGGCWCMWWRTSSSQFEKQHGEGNRQAMKEIVEAYPTQPKSERLHPVPSFMGVPSVFERADFVECARPSQSKVIMSYYVPEDEDAQE